MKKNTLLFFATILIYLSCYDIARAQTVYTCETPNIITSLPFTETGNTVNYGNNYNEFDVPPLAPGAIGIPAKGYLNGYEVVYAYTPVTDKLIDIAVSNHGTWTGVFVFTGCPFASTVGGHTVNTYGPVLTVNELPVIAGTTYYIVISTFSPPLSTTYTLSVSNNGFDCPVLGVNIGDSCDDGDPSTINDAYDADCNCLGEFPTPGSVCANAIAIDCTSGSSTFSSAASNGTNTTSCTMGNKGLWFSFMGTGGDIIVNSSATFDHEMSINSGSCESLTNIVCIDASSSPNETYTITSSVLGEMYYIYIAHYATGNNTTGDITISLNCILCLPPSLDLTLQDENGDPIIDCINSGDDFYVLATLSGGHGNTSYSVSANNGTAVVVAANNSTVFGPFVLGTNVSVNAIGVQDTNCSISKWVTPATVCPVSNNTCVGSISLVCGETITGSTANATASGLAATCGSYTSSTALDVFYSFEADGTSSYAISLDAAPSASFDGVLFVYSGACGNLTSLGCSDSGNPEEMELIAPAAGIYTVRLFKYSGTENYTLNLECTPDPSLSINNNMLAGARLFPNPLSDGTFYIQAPKLNSEQVEVNILDMAGRQIFNNTLSVIDNKISISINNTWNAGVYFVTLKHAGEVHTYKLIKN